MLDNALEVIDEEEAGEELRRLLAADDGDLSDAELRVKYAPVHYGPAWERDSQGRLVLPERTLGWQVARWCADYLNPLGDGDEVFAFTLEQLRIVLWWYAVDENGAFLYPSRGMLQRIKGWGKDPLLAVLCLVEAFGPTKFSGWDRDGSPIAVRRPQALVQIFAVSQDQTNNTFDMFHVLVSERLKADYGVKVMLQIVRGCNNTARIEVKTKAVRSAEGNRATFALLNETQHWVSENNGHNLKNTVAGNLSKMRGRYLAITNAYKPGEGSVAEKERDSFMMGLEGLTIDDKAFFDSLEAPPHAPLNERVFKIVYEMVRGDSVWCDPVSAWNTVLDPSRPPSESRRMFYNQVWQGEGHLYSSAEWKAIERKGVLEPGDTICLGFDGGKSDDATALVAIRVRDSLMVPLLLEERPEGLEGKWEVDRARVDSKVHEVMRTYKVVGFFADVALWESYIHEWEVAYGEQMVARPGGGHSIACDMRGSKKRFATMHETFMGAVLDQRVFAGGSRELALAFRRHALNAVRRDTPYGVSFMKDGRESKRKVDMYAAAMLAHGALCEYQLEEAAKVAKPREAGAFYMW